MKSYPPIPKEHGAWALLYGPFLVVLLAFGHLQARTFLLVATLTAFFLAHEPLARLSRLAPTARTGARATLWKRWVGLYAILGLLFSGLLLAFYGLWNLLPLGAGVALLLTLHLLLASKRKERTLAGELIGALGLTAGAPIAYYVLTEELDGTALLLWFLNLLYFVSGIFYVKMRLSRFMERNDAGQRTWNCVLYHLFLLLSLALLISQQWLSAIAIAAFAPIVIRAFWPLIRGGGGRLNLKKIGYSEVAFTAFFVLVLSLTLRAR
ncbi:MAG: YwiC-like family protein [Acidobacteriota bacterium]